MNKEDLDKVLREHKTWLCSVTWPREGTRAVLRGADLTDAVLTGAVLTRADLRGADLTGAVLTRADLTGADLTGAVLTGAVLTLDDVPLVERLDAQILESIEAAPASLDMSAWHGEAPECGTTHCRAGWAVHKAGEAGYALEAKVGSAVAGLLIYLKSTGVIPDFYCDNQEALEDIRACAAKQSGGVR